MCEFSEHAKEKRVMENACAAKEKVLLSKLME